MNLNGSRLGVPNWTDWWGVVEVCHARRMPRLLIHECVMKCMLKAVGMNTGEDAPLNTGGGRCANGILWYVHNCEQAAVDYDLLTEIQVFISVQYLKYMYTWIFDMSIDDMHVQKIKFHADSNKKLVSRKNMQNNKIAQRYCFLLFRQTVVDIVVLVCRKTSFIILITI